MIKKILCVILSLVMVLCFASCGTSGEIDTETEAETLKAAAEPSKKVVIMVAPESQYPEDYRVAKALEKKYPDTVVVKEYADSRVITAENPEIITISEEVAGDESVGAIIYARATQFAYDAIQRVKSKNSDIFTVAIEPESDISDMCSAASLVIAANWKKYATDIITESKNQGAENFVFLSFSRHVNSNPLYAQLVSYFQSECESQGITYIYKDISDTNSETVSVANENVKETLNYLFNRGMITSNNTTVFSTVSLSQEAIVNYVKERGLIYICPSFPTAYNGIGEAYDIEYSDIDSYVKAVKTAVNSGSENKGRFSIYTYSLVSALETGALYTAFDYLNGETDAEYAVETAILRLKEASGRDDFTAEAAFEKNGVECYAPGFETIE